MADEAIFELRLAGERLLEIAVKPFVRVVGRQVEHLDGRLMSRQVIRDVRRVWMRSGSGIGDSLDVRQTVMVLELNRYSKPQVS